MVLVPMSLVDWWGIETNEEKIAVCVNWSCNGREQSLLRGQIGPAGSGNHPCTAQTRETSLGFLAFHLVLGIWNLETSTFSCSSRNDNGSSYPGSHLGPPLLFS